jgi:LmbE family N-acetylglucosaminyl deacetylase
MHSLNLPFAPTSRPRILCLGAHADDIEIGCGGTILRLARQYPNCALHWVVFSAPDVRAAEAQRAAALFAGKNIDQGPVLKQFQDGFLPFSGAEVKAIFEEMKAISPDLIFTHQRNDAHQDHRLLAELTWNTFRDHLILEYEIPKFDGDLGQPNVFLPLESELCERKIRYLMDSFASQRVKRWFEPELFRGIMRLRGMECNSPSGYAEAFYSRKVAL